MRRGGIRKSFWLIAIIGALSWSRGVFFAPVAMAAERGDSSAFRDEIIDLTEMPEIDQLLAAPAIENFSDKYPLPPTLENLPANSSAIPLSLKSAVTQALHGNLELRIAELSPAASEQAVRLARAAFDPSLSLRAAYVLLDESSVGTTFTEQNAVGVGAGISEYFPTGTTVKIDADWNDAFRKSAANSSGSQQTGGTVGITQKLLKGRGLGVNLISVEQARLDHQISRFQLQDAVEDLLARVENTYWDLVLARQQIVIMRDALKIAAERLRETETKVGVGALAPADVAQSRADIASAYTDLIAARSSYQQLKLELLVMLNAEYPAKLNTLLAVEQMPPPPAVELDNIDAHVALGLSARPDINEAKLRLRKNELEIKRAQNGLLPDLDLTIEIGGGGGANRTASHWQNTDGIAIGGRINFSQPLGRRAAKAEARRAEISAEQAKIAVTNLQRQIAVNIRSHYLNVRRYEQQMVSTALAATQYAIALQMMREKFRVGIATSLDVATAEHYYTESRRRAAEAIINTIKQLTALYRADGSLLARRGVQINGN